MAQKQIYAKETGIPRSLMRVWFRFYSSLPRYSHSWNCPFLYASGFCVVGKEVDEVSRLHFGGMGKKLHNAVNSLPAEHKTGVYAEGKSPFQPFYMVLSLTDPFRSIPTSSTTPML